MANLDRLFHALSDPTRRAVVERLMAGPQPVSALAAGSPMALPSFLKHLRVLEGVGLIATEKQGRVRLCRLEAEGLLPVQDWLADQRSLWEARTERLDHFVTNGESEE